MTNKGFTLMEVMISLAILGIMMAIAIPSFHRFQCIISAADLNLNRELSSRVCRDCKSCKGITPSEALKRIASGQSTFEDFIFVKAGENITFEPEQKVEALDELKTNNTPDLVKDLEVKVKELEEQLVPSPDTKKSSWKD